MMKLKIRKIFAVYFDYFLCFDGVDFFATKLIPTVEKQPYIIHVIFSLSVCFLILFLFVMKDFLFKGQSLGKRIFRLKVCNEANRKIPENKLLFIRGIIETFTIPLDIFLILFGGKQLTDYICKTELLSTKK